jgi:hypothetical protein
MERFAEDLRDVVDPNDIVERLEGVLTEVFEPRHVTLWFREVEAPHVRGPSSNP